MLPTFTAIHRFQESGSVSAAVPKGCIAAALTMISRPPCVLTVWATTDLTWSGWLTSQVSTSSDNPLACASCCSSWLADDSMPHATTLHPPAARRFAIARPIPVVPVTIATWFQIPSYAWLLLVDRSGPHCLGRSTVQTYSANSGMAYFSPSTTPRNSARPFNLPTSE